MKKYAIKVDDAACWGCRTCEVACRQELGLPDRVRVIKMEEKGPAMMNGKLDFFYTINLCRHCDEPPCMDACRDGAIYKREDSIVVMDYNKCTGCRLCIDACPYGSIDFDDDGGTAKKCNLCHERVDRGLIPACADNVCLAYCIHFGDPDGIAEKIEKQKLIRQGLYINI